MDCILKKEDFIFNKTSYLSFYEYEINGFKLQINEEDFTEEELVFSGKLLDLYSENLTKIIDACVKSETFKYYYRNSIDFIWSISFNLYLIKEKK